ncbi:hypothetical protein HOY82DRAFT_611093 [Tuber indicum]|nr:hypothetical protein HOY82DRAFT_611093 [Tuber indicum]
MAKRKRGQMILPPASAAEPKSTKGKSAKPPIKKPNATVYDAVASRVNYAGMINAGYEDKHGEFRRRSMRAVPADEVLARRKNAPEVIPYGEGVERMLPDTDLLIAIHQYASDFYGANGMGPASYRSMDETALLGIGVLLEESVRTCLGKEGELALIDEEAFDPIDPYEIRRQRSLAYSQSQREAANLKRESGQTEGTKKKKRKRKVVKNGDGEEEMEAKAIFGVGLRDEKGELADEREGATTKRKKRSSRKKSKKHREKERGRVDEQVVEEQEVGYEGGNVAGISG